MAFWCVLDKNVNACIDSTTYIRTFLEFLYFLKHEFVFSDVQRKGIEMIEYNKKIFQISRNDKYFDYELWYFKYLLV